MNAINRSNAVIEFDLDGNVKFANDLFLNTLGYSQDEIIGKNHNLFIEDDVKNSKEYKDFWKSLREGKFFSGEITRRKKDGKLIYLQATYKPIIGSNVKPYRIMKIATDITENINQQREIEKKNTYLEHNKAWVSWLSVLADSKNSSDLDSFFNENFNVTSTFSTATTNIEKAVPKVDFFGTKDKVNRIIQDDNDLENMFWRSMDFDQ